jgi:2-haloalkanoic acid dehalogenase type II
LVASYALMIKALIFDCWNTLFFTDKDPHPFWVIAEKLGKERKDYSFWKAFERHLMVEKDKSIEEGFRTLMDELKVPRPEGFVNELTALFESVKEYQKPYPDTIETLKRLGKKYKLGMITNTDFFGFDIIEKKFDLESFFDVILKSYETKLLKPDPRVFELMLNRLGVKKEEALMVGDSLPDDIVGAKACGIKAVLIDRRGRFPDYHERITELHQLDRYLVD